MEDTTPAPDPFRRDWLPLVLVLSGPSGAGKDAVVRGLKERGFPFYFVVTATDRAPRPGEVDGQDYYFFTTAEFERMIADDELLEHAWVYGQHKGIPKAHIREAIVSGKDVVMRVDVQGAAKLKGLLPAVVTIFLTCESEEELVARLRERQTEPEEGLRRRLETARRELERIAEFDYVVVNRHDDLDAAVDDMLAIIRAEHCRAVPRAIHL